MIRKALHILFGRIAPDIGEDLRRETTEAVSATRTLRRVAYDQVSDAYRVDPYKAAAEDVIESFRRAQRRDP